MLRLSRHHCARWLATAVSVHGNGLYQSPLRSNENPGLALQLAATQVYLCSFDGKPLRVSSDTFAQPRQSA